MRCMGMYSSGARTGGTVHSKTRAGRTMVEPGSWGATASVLPGVAAGIVSAKTAGRVVALAAPPARGTPWGASVLRHRFRIDGMLHQPQNTIVRWTSIPNDAAPKSRGDANWKAYSNSSAGALCRQPRAGRVVPPTPPMALSQEAIMLDQAAVRILGFSRSMISQYVAQRLRTPAERDVHGAISKRASRCQRNLNSSSDSFRSSL